MTKRQCIECELKSSCKLKQDDDSDCWCFYKGLKLKDHCKKCEHLLKRDNRNNDYCKAYKVPINMLDLSKCKRKKIK